MSLMQIQNDHFIFLLIRCHLLQLFQLSEFHLQQIQYFCFNCSFFSSSAFVSSFFACLPSSLFRAYFLLFLERIHTLLSQFKSLVQVESANWVEKVAMFSKSTAKIPHVSTHYFPSIFRISGPAFLIGSWIQGSFKPRFSQIFFKYSSRSSILG